jgi:hypothetical protein
MIVNSIGFVIKSLILSVFKIRNLKTLFYRLNTVAIVAAHYIIVEKIPIEYRVKNEENLALFLLVWHLVFMNFKIGEQSRVKKNEKYKIPILTILLVFGAFTLLTVVLAPVLAYFNVPFTELKTSYWGQRYLFMFLYILLNVIINVFPLVNNFLFFLSDGIILSQLTSLYMINEFSMSALLTSLPYLFVL